ncbi:PLP-dependent aminotransferase family protein [Megasphaera vaginalis (ex Bordigoni et al. 2020)]|uniref:MocR-like pyridoxine biosynthesis transcription factor PdxR n=1 Tax=Megasphaera vaginalis (ex Bordigoni et al. 2020) TaxID=2045301 RepID=UPI000C7E2F87|nr:PLP-dependent aminotransferase family protein [Megasphaera vaginalis (ex Bordigoni et al. 2020)]
MLTYVLDGNRSGCLYERLYNCIKEDILTQVLQAGEKLPSKRSLASHLQISTMTVETAYGQLLAEGYIYSVAKKGFYVSPFSNHGRISQRRAPQSLPVTKTAETVYFADFVSNEIQPEMFPFAAWTKTMRAVMAEEQEQLVRCTPAGGALALRLAICDHLRHFRGMYVEPEQVIVGAGTEYLYGLLIRFFGPERVYCLEDPGYAKMRMIYAYNNAACVYAGVSDDGIKMADVRRQLADVVHISPSHQFPTGLIMPIAKRYELLSWANECDGRHILEDEYDSEFRFTGRPIPTLFSIDASGKVIYMNTFSKSLSPTIRISYLVLPPELVLPFKEKLGFLSCTVSNFEQYTLARFMGDGFFERHLNHVRTAYRHKRDHLIRALKRSPLSKKTEIIEASAGLHFLLQADIEDADAQVIERCRKEGLRLTSLSQYYFNPLSQREHTFIINYSTLEETRIDEAVRKLCRAMLRC